MHTHARMHRTHTHTRTRARTHTHSDVWEPHTRPVRLDHWWDYRGYLYRIDTSGARVLYYGNVDGPWQEVIGNQAHMLKSTLYSV